MKIEYAQIDAAEGKEHLSPLFIHHGLFGSKQNWRSLSKAFNSRTGRKVSSDAEPYLVGGRAGAVAPQRFDKVTIHYYFTTDKVCHSLKFIKQPVLIEPKPFDFGNKS